MTAEPALNTNNILAEKYPTKLLISKEIWLYGPKKDVKLPSNVKGFTCERIGFSFTDVTCDEHLMSLDHVNGIGTMIGASLFKRDVDDERLFLGYFMDEKLSEDEVNADIQSISEHFTVNVSVLFVVYKTHLNFL
jgi:hypothetical protein